MSWAACVATLAKRPLCSAATYKESECWLHDRFLKVRFPKRSDPQGAYMCSFFSVASRGEVKTHYSSARVHCAQGLLE